VARTQQSAHRNVDVPDGVRPEAWRVAYLVRELRRAAGSQRFRHHLYGTENVLDPGQHDALDAVISLGHARMNELATTLRVDRSTASRTIERLENLDLVERRPDPHDGRFVVVLATRAGLRRQQLLAKHARRAFDELFERFDNAQLVTFGDLLEQLVAGIDDFCAPSQE
jgi:DNA-binding MarR family transcriptional regulator